MSNATGSEITMPRWAVAFVVSWVAWVSVTLVRIDSKIEVQTAHEKKIENLQAKVNQLEVELGSIKARVNLKP